MNTGITRRDFLVRSLAGGALALPFIAQLACTDNVTDPTEQAVLDLSTDAGVMNYFYAITQLQSDFWTRVSANRFPGITTVENSAFAAIGSHATSQRNWLSAFQTSGRISDVILFSFADTVDFSSRASTMSAALAIEDGASQAYTGGVGYLKSDANILLAAKLASIAARHSATLRDLNDLAAGGASRTSFGGDDIVGSTGLEIVKTPSEVVGSLQKYMKTTLNVQNG
jgi:hypothetical protein